MDVTREQFIQSLRRHIGTKFGHQGRNAMTGMDCGGLLLICARENGLSELEFLGYADFPIDGKFEELLQQHTEHLFSKNFPFNFSGEELLPGDLVSFDYGNGEGTRHVAMVTGWDGHRYRIIEALPDYGVTEHALAPPFVRHGVSVQGWKIKGI